MGQAIANLVENACQAMEAEEGRSETSHVRITARCTNEVLELQVLDNGPGIPQEVMPNLFEPLYSTRSFGIGLGLPLVKQIVEEHGGAIHVRSVPNSETTMTIRLPNS